MTRDIVSSGRSKWIDGRLVEYVQKKRWNSEDGGTRGWVIYNYSIYPNATHIHRVRMETRSVRVVAPVVPFAARRLSGNDRVHTRYIIISIVAFATVRALPSPPGFHRRGFSKSSSRAVATVKIRQALSKRPCSLPNREPLLPPPPFVSFESCSIFFFPFFYFSTVPSLSSFNSI